MRRSYLDYAMSVIVARALPDVRDGLKPVHRRILYAMNENGNTWNRPYRKSATAVGEVMGNYHPHGDLAIYDALVRMAQSFSMELPLIDGQGNFGSMDGDPPAAMRYTEARLSRAADALLDDIDKNTVDFQPNYDERRREPKVLPARFPNVLVNGGSGIAVGMATNIPTHNLGEVIDACCAFLDNPNIADDEVMNLVQGPDFPTGGIILGRSGIHAAFKLGRGSIVVRGKHHVEEIRKDRDAIVFTEIPYQVNKSRLLERIGETMREKIIEGIADLRDESDRDGVRVVIELKRDAMAEVVVNQLFRFTPLQTSFPVNAVVLNNGRPETMSLRDMIAAFLAFREEVVPVDASVSVLVQRLRFFRSLDPMPADGRLLARPVSKIALVHQLRDYLHRVCYELKLSTRIVPHQFRHTYATEMLRAGVTFPVLMKLLGHVDPAMTMRYVDIALTDLQREFNQARSHPRYLIPKPTASSPQLRAGLDGVLDSLIAAQHAIEIFRRPIPKGDSRARLDRLANRLSKILREARKLRTA